MYEYNKEIKKGWDILLDYLLLFTLLYYTYYFTLLLRHCLRIQPHQ